MEETCMAFAIMVESGPAERVQRYPLPVSRQETAATRFVKRITDDAGTCVRRSVKSPRPAGLSSCSAEIEQWDRPD